jgi:hypothetical protein
MRKKLARKSVQEISRRGLQNCKKAEREPGIQERVMSWYAGGATALPKFERVGFCRQLVLGSQIIQISSTKIVKFIAILLRTKFLGTILA